MYSSLKRGLDGLETLRGVCEACRPQAGMDFPSAQALLDSFGTFFWAVLVGNGSEQSAGAACKGPEDLPALPGGLATSPWHTRPEVYQFDASDSEDEAKDLRRTSSTPPG